MVALLADPAGPVKLVVDTDTATDDATALLLAAKSPNVELLAVTIVSGNVDFDQQAENALIALEVAGANGQVPVYLGCRKPLVAEHHPVPHVHGIEGMGDANLPRARQRSEAEHAVEALRRLAREHPGEVVVCAIGPLTNLAQAFSLDPELPSLLRRVYFMGGSYRYPGNITPVASFNAWADPEAARIVLRSGVPITLCGFGLSCQYAVLDDADYAAFERADTPESRFFVAINRGRLAYCKARQKLAGSNHPDTLTVAVATDLHMSPVLLSAAVDVELSGEYCRGQLVMDELEVWGRPPNAEVCVEADSRRFKALVYRAHGVPLA